MKKEERIALFKEELDWISSEDLKNFAGQTLSCVPDYFFRFLHRLRGNIIRIMQPERAVWCVTRKRRCDLRTIYSLLRCIRKSLIRGNRI